MTDVRREQFPLLWSTAGTEAVLAKGFCSMVDTKYPCVCRRTQLPGRGVHSEKVREIEINSRLACRFKKKKKKKCIQNCTVADAYCLSGVRCAIIGQFGWSGRRAPGEIKRSRDLRGGRWSWTLTFAQKRS